MGKKEIEIGSFKTFEQGKPERQVAEFLATIFDYELYQHGFTCQRKEETIVFQGLPEKAGLNLRLADYYVDPDKHAKYRGVSCDFGLQIGLSSLQPGQIKGKSPIISYGRYLLNQVEINLCSIKQEAPTLEKVKEELLRLFNEQSHYTLVEAFFDPFNHLVLKHYQPGSRSTIQIKKIQELTSQATEHIELDIPCGQFTGKDNLELSQSDLDLGSFKLNGISFDFGMASSEKSLETVLEGVLQTINSKSLQAGVVASLSADNLIVLDLLNPEGSLTISDICNHQGQPLDMSPLGFKVTRFSNPDYVKLGFFKSLEHYVSAVNQLTTEIRFLLTSSPESESSRALKTLESKLYDALLNTLPVEYGLYIKEPFVEMLGLQLEYSQDELNKNWPNWREPFLSYFQQLYSKLKDLFGEVAPLANMTGKAEIEQEKLTLGEQLMFLQPITTPAPSRLAAKPPLSVKSRSEVRLNLRFAKSVDEGR